MIWKWIKTRGCGILPIFPYKNELTTGAWKDDISCPINNVLGSTSDGIQQPCDPHLAQSPCPQEIRWPRHGQDQSSDDHDDNKVDVMRTGEDDSLWRKRQRLTVPPSVQARETMVQPPQSHMARWWGPIASPISHHSTMDLIKSRQIDSWNKTRRMLLLRCRTSMTFSTAPTLGCFQMTSNRQLVIWKTHWFALPCLTPCRLARPWCHLQVSPIWDDSDDNVSEQWHSGPPDVNKGQKWYHVPITIVGGPTHLFPPFFSDAPLFPFFLFWQESRTPKNRQTMNKEQQREALFLPRW